MSNIRVDADAFFRRVKRIYDAWKQCDETKSTNDEMSEVDALICAVGADGDVVYSKSTSTQTWLFGYELSDTLLVCAEQNVTFLASKKKIEFLKQVENADRPEGVPPMKLLTRDKGDNDHRNFEQIFENIKTSRKGTKLGVFSKDFDKFPGAFMTALRTAVDYSKLEKTDISSAIAFVMAPREESEINLVKKACQVTLEIYSKYLKEQIMDIIDNDKKVKHTKLAEGVEKAVTDQKYAPNLDTQQLDLCYPAIIQSGGNYKLKFSVSSDKEYVHFGAIVCTFGARYKSYCSNIARTMLVDPSEKIQKIYEFLVELEELVFDQLKVGAKMSDVYETVLTKTRKDRPDLEDKLTKTFGFVMGIEFREPSLSIAPNSQAVVKNGMVFNVNIGLSGLVNKEAEDKRGKTVSLFIGDTIVVNGTSAEGQHYTLLTHSKKKIKNIAIFLKDDESQDEDESQISVDKLDSQKYGRGRRTAVLDQKLRADSTQDDKRKLHQKELMEKMNEEALRRIKEGNGTHETVKERKAPVSYKSTGQLPRESEVRSLKIYVDKKYETVILPIFGIPVPFHIANIKNISSSIEGDSTYLRVNFFHPGAVFSKNLGNQTCAPAGFVVPLDATFVKELTYRSTNSKEPGELSAPSSNLNTAFRLIKDIQKTRRVREAEESEKSNLVHQDSLVLGIGKGNPKLKDLYIRPNIVQKRLIGVLEAHTNGFRYTSIRGDKVDILYNNIKHAFYQPCDGEMIILLHFHLKNAIMFGKKKHIDVQFYTEVGEITTDLGKHQHMHDRDDLAAEQAERELRHKLKQAFKGFCEKVEGVTKGELEFDSPFRELGYHGVPFRETVLLLPTSACLISLTQWPPFVITLEDIQLVHFERVQFQLKNFDMVFIFKDYNKKVMMVTAVPMTMLDHVKEWLNSVDIKYTEGVQSLNWGKIMKTIIDDPEGFFESGGWSFLDPNSGSEAEGDEDEDLDSEDEEFKVEAASASGGEDEDSDDDYSSEDENASDEDIDDELDSDESSGKDWSDLEREAEEDDEEHEEDEDARRRGGHRPSHRPSHKNRTPQKSHGSHLSNNSSARDKHGTSHSDKRKRESSSGGKHHKSSKQMKSRR